MRQQVTSLVKLLLLYVVLATRASHAKPTNLDQSAHDSYHHHGSSSEQQQQQADSQDNYMNYVKQQRSPSMQVHKLASAGNNGDNNITCNDGSQIGYYKRLNQHSKSWVIYLQGGGFCGSHESCLQRWHQTPFLMSSKYWPTTKTVDGILSSDPKENPYLWNANHIYVPYCSSDSWTGSAQVAPRQQSGSSGDESDETRSGSPGQPSSFAFLGSKIIERVFDSLYDDLPLRQSLYDAKFILLAGDSAGATGVILNLDKMTALVERRANHLKANCTQNYLQCEVKQSDPVLRGLADSGWFLDNEPYNFELEFGEPISGGSSSSTMSKRENESQQQPAADCDQGRCTPLQSIRQAMQLWNGQVPESCLQNYADEPWRCYFGYRVYQTLKTPLFVVQWLYDEAQLMVDNIVRPGTSGQWNYVNKVVKEMRASLENVTALFAPSCLSHSLIARKSWNQININGFRLPHILNSWEEQPSSLDTGSDGQMVAAISTPISSRLDALERQPVGNGKMLMRDLASGGIGNQPTFETVLVEQEPHSPSTAASAFVGPTGMAAAAAFYLRSADRLSAPSESRNQIMTNRQTAGTATSASASNSNTNSAATGGAGNGQAKSRSRKRKRNNQQHQNRIKQAGRQRSSQQQITTTQNGPLESATPSYSSSSFREANDLQPHQQAGSPNPLQDLLPLLEGSLGSAELLYGRVNRPADQANGSGIRLGRSTIVDDATLMLSNNVPDDAGSIRNRMSQLAMAPSAANAHASFQDQSGESARWSSDSRPQGLNYGAYTTPGRDTTGPNQFRFIDSCGWPHCNRDCPVLSFDFSSGLSVQF